MPDPREQLGRIVREIWVAFAIEQGDTRPSRLAGWDDLDPGNREVDMRIGAAVAAAERERILAKLGSGELVLAKPAAKASPEEQARSQSLLRDLLENPPFGGRDA